MNKKLTYTLSAIGTSFVIFNVGFLFGVSSHQKRMENKMNNLSSLFNNAFTNVFTKGIEDNLTIDQMVSLINEELEFIRIATR